ncbi:MAG: hypothetical protein ACYS0G_12330 [Planctomycetota bacterium]|jgi:hypothetical protein
MSRTLALLTVLAATVWAPDSAGGRPQEGQASPALDPVPLVAEAFGLKMSVPAGAVITSQATERGVTYLLTDGGEVGAWSMRIGALISSLSDPTPAAMAERQIQAVRATGRPFRVIADEPGRYGTAEGRLLYLQQTLEGGALVINGWLILPMSGRSFLVMSVVTTADQFASLRPLFDACFATVHLRNEQEIRALREARLERGRAVVDTFTPAELRSALGDRKWYRIYQPAAPGQREDDTEVGFLSIQSVEARRGELTPERSPDSYGQMEAELGLMVMVDARAVINAANNHYLDVQGRYWMAWDRTRESWSLRQTQRQGRVSRTTAETGVRDRGILNVIHSSKEEFTREPSQWSIPDKAYLSQAEVFLLGKLLPRDGSIAGDMAFYHYDNRLQRLPQRIDRWQPAGDGSGSWTLTTQPVLSAGSVTQVFDAAGDRVRRIDGDGKVTERIDPNELRRLWQAKGLLTG